MSKTKEKDTFQELDKDVFSEWQNVVAFKLFEVMHDREVTKAHPLQSALYNQYHGNAAKGIASFCKLAYEGQSCFAGLYEQVDPASPKRCISRVLTRDESNVYFRGEHFSLVHMYRSRIGCDKKKITGVNLVKHAKIVLKNCKVAMSIAQKVLLGPNKGDLPSGTSLGDFYEHILAEMDLCLSGNLQQDELPTALDDPDEEEEQQRLDDVCSETLGKSTTKAGDGGDDEDEVLSAMAGGNTSTTDVRSSKRLKPSYPTRRKNPQKAFFPGFWAFVLFGPMAPKAQQTALFHMDPRREAAKRKERERDVEKQQRGTRSLELSDRLKRLDEEFFALQAKENILRQALAQLRREEEYLLRGISEASSTPAVTQKTKAEALAVARLEQALLLDLDSSSSSDEA
jgi:hypothetical protein